MPDGSIHPYSTHREYLRAINANKICGYGNMKNRKGLEMKRMKNRKINSMKKVKNPYN